MPLKKDTTSRVHESWVPKKVHQFTCIKQKAADNTEVQGSLQNYKSSVKKTYSMSPFWHIEFGGHSLICKTL